MVRGGISIVAMVLAATGSLAVAPAAWSQQPDERGAYIGGSFGQTTFKDFCSDIRSGGYAGGSCDEKDSAWKFFGGYRINRHFAVEASYINWGEASVDGGTFRGLAASGRGEVTSMGVAALGIVPVSDSFYLFGKIGMLSTDVEVSVNVAGFPGSGSESETEAHFGLGAGFNITRNLSVRGEWERADDTKADMISVGLQYRF